MKTWIAIVASMVVIGSVFIERCTGKRPVQRLRARETHRVPVRRPACEVRAAR